MNSPTTSLALAILVTGLAFGTARAQEVDNTQILPDAEPGDCFAKVITPAKFETRTEEVVVQEASERVETIPAEYETTERTIVVEEASQTIEAKPAVFSTVTEEVEVRPAETLWTVRAELDKPASPGALDGIERSGVELDSVEPGSCFREYFTPADYRVGERRVLVKEGSERVETTPAVYETVEERVLVKEASSQVVDVPAVYRTETESVLVEPARSVWRTDGCGLVEQVSNTTGDVMCLVEVPARYETLTKTVLDKPATTRTVSVPAEYDTIEVRRLVTPASEKRVEIEPEYISVETREKIADAGFFWLTKGEAPDGDASWSGQEVCLVERPAEYETVERQVVEERAETEIVEVPARYRTIEVQRLVSPADERRIEIPARTKTVVSQEQVAPSKLEWRRVLCEANMTPRIVSSLQRALEREGFDPGPVDGVLGRSTLRAIERYQTEMKLDRGGLTYETLKSLEVQS